MIFFQKRREIYHRHFLTIIYSMAPKKNNNNEGAASDTAQNDYNNNNSSQQRQNTDANNNLTKEKNGNSQRIGGDGPRAKPVSRSKKAGVIFPVLQILRRLKDQNRGKVVQNATAVYMAGVLEYLVAEVVELAGNAASENKRKRIIPRHILLAIQNDEELNKVCENVTIASGGVLPHIHEVLLTTKHSSQSSRNRSSQSKKQSQGNSTNTSANSMDDPMED